MNDLMAEAAHWKDTSECNKDVVARFTEYVNADAGLKAHRDFIEQHIYGMGERSFHWMWKLIVDEMPDEFSFLEIGVWKGQVPSLIRLLAQRTKRMADIVGVTPLNAVSADGYPYPDEDYAQHIKNLHDHFDQPLPRICKGDSTDPKVQQAIGKLPKFDIVYIDGCHEYDYVVNDILFYGARLREGGFLVMDDASCYLAPVWGFFQGIEGVCQAVRAIIETDRSWAHLLAVMHNRVFQRVGLSGERELEPIQAYRWAGGPDGNVAVAV